MMKSESPAGRREKLSPEVKELVIQLWVDGKELGEIKDAVRSRFGVSLSDEELVKFLPSTDGEVEEVGMDEKGIFRWLFEWQLERLKKYRQMERKLGAPIPDVKANIALMLTLLEKQKSVEVLNWKKEIFGVDKK